MENKNKLYKELNFSLAAMFEGCEHVIANLANASALLFDALEDINWAGFYLMEKGKLVLGPFQGKVACVEIELGRGVCGSAALSGETVVVPNVHEFAGHIPCDGASNSEIVIPLFVGGELFGVLDIDSPVFDRFSVEDVCGLEEFAKTVERAVDRK
jgi:GAF domain-containing protein